jgi:hypothetical protein
MPPDWPPVVEKNFQWPPVGDPTKDKETLFRQSPARPRRRDRAREMVTDRAN